MASLITRSFSSLRRLVASLSSRMRGGGGAHARARCAAICPQEGELPISPSSVSQPHGHVHDLVVYGGKSGHLLIRSGSGERLKPAMFSANRASEKPVILQYVPDLGTVRLKSLPFCNLEKDPSRRRGCREGRTLLQSLISQGSVDAQE